MRSQASKPPQPLPSSRPESRVTKKLHPGAPGTTRLRAQYGSHLLCVRYRETLDGKKRMTTVELIVSSRDIPQLDDDSPVSLRIGPQEHALQAKLREFGAQWDSKNRLWKTRLLIARHLDLIPRIVPMPGRSEP